MSSSNGGIDYEDVPTPGMTQSSYLNHIPALSTFAHIPSESAPILTNQVANVHLHAQAGPDPHVAGPKAHARCGAPPLFVSPLLSFFSPPATFCPNTSLPFPSYSLFKFSFFPSSSFVPIFPPFPVPKARGPRHVPFVPLWGSGTVILAELCPHVRCQLKTTTL